MAGMDVLLGDAGNSNALAGSIPPLSDGRLQPLHVADDSDVTPRDLVLDKRVNDYITFVRRSSAAVDVTRPLHFDATFHIVEDIVLLEQL